MILSLDHGDNSWGLQSMSTACTSGRKTGVGKGWLPEGPTSVTSVHVLAGCCLTNCRSHFYRQMLHVL